jgi:hypothetical protein
MKGRSGGPGDASQSERGASAGVHPGDDQSGHGMPIQVQTGGPR